MNRTLVKGSSFYLFIQFFILLLLWNNSLQEEEKLSENTSRYSSIQKDNAQTFVIEQDSYPSLNYIFISLYVYSGNADLNVFDMNEGNQPIGKLYAANHKQFYEIYTGNANINWRILVKVSARDNCYFSVKYTTSNSLSNHLFYIIHNEISLQTLTFREKSKQFIIKNPSSSSDRDFLITVNSINCLIKTTFNQNDYFNRSLQMLIKPNEDVYKEGDYSLTVQLLSLDSGNVSDEEMCMFYISGNLLGTSSSSLLLIEGMVHSFRINKNIGKLVFRFPFYLKHSNENLFIFFNKKNMGELTLRYYLYEIENAGKEKEYTISSIVDKRYMIPNQEMTNICELGTICWLCVIIENNDSFTEDIPFDIQLLSSHLVPTYLPFGQMKLDVVYALQSRYYYSTVNKGQSGEIVVNFKRGGCNGVAKLVPLGTKEENPNWNQRIHLPDNNTKNQKGIIQYDSFNKKFVFTEKDSEICDNGCEIYIGIFSTDLSMFIGTPIYEYSIFIRIEDTVVNIFPDEHVFGSLSRTEKENEFDYFAITVNHNTNEIVFRLNSALCGVYINYGSSMPTPEHFDWYYNGNNPYLKISSHERRINENTLFGKRFTIAISAKFLDGEYDAFYDLKITTPILDLPPIIIANSAQNEQCEIDEYTDRCYFIIPKYLYDFIYKIFLYAILEKENSSSLEMYANIIEMKLFDNFKTKQILDNIPSESHYQFSSKGLFKSNYLTVDYYGFIADSYLLVAVKSPIKGTITLLTSYHSTSNIASLKPNTKEMFYLNPGQIVNFNIIGDQVYYIEVNHIQGNGLVKLLNKNESMITNEDYISIGDNMKKSIGMVIKSKKVDVFLNIKARENIFVFYISFFSRSRLENLDKIMLGRNNYIVYEQKYFEQAMFPLNYYINLSEKEIDNIEVNFSIRCNNQICSSFIDISGALTTETFILQRKRNKEALPEAIELLSDVSYNEGLGIGYFRLNRNNYGFITGNQVLFFSLNVNKDYQCEKIAINIIAVSEKKKSIPSNKLYISKNNIPLLLHKNDYDDIYFDIFFSAQNNNMSLLFNCQNNSNMKYNETESIGGKRYVIELINEIELLVSFNGISSFGIYYSTYKEKKAISFYIEDPTIKYNQKENSTYFLLSPVVSNNIISNIDIRYTLRVYENYQFKDNDNIESIYNDYHTNQIFYNISNSSSNILFKVDNLNMKESIINAFAMINTQYNNEEIEEIIIYQTPIILKQIEESPRIHSLFYIICIIFCILIFIGICMYMKYTKMVSEQSKENIELYQIINKH